MSGSDVNITKNTTLCFHGFIQTSSGPPLIPGSLIHRGFWVTRSLENPNFPQAHPAFHWVEPFPFLVRWVSCCASWCQSSLQSPSGPLLHLAPQLLLPPSLALQTIFIIYLGSNWAFNSIPTIPSSSFRHQLSLVQTHCPPPLCHLPSASFLTPETQLFQARSSGIVGGGGQEAGAIVPSRADISIFVLIC